jgi:hypothetical protein
MHFAEPVLNDIGEANQDGQSDSAPLQRIDELLQVNTAVRFFGRMNKKMPVFANGKISFPPACDIVELGSVCGGPAIGRLAYGRGDGSDFRIQ